MGRDSLPRRMATAPDGTLWVTLYGKGMLAKVDPAAMKVVNTYPLPGGNAGAYAVTVDGAGTVAGVFTDGDLRRAIEKGQDLRKTAIADIMSPNPRTIGPDRLAAEAVEIMERSKVTQLLVVDDGGRLLGALNIHDLFRGKVV